MILFLLVLLAQDPDPVQQGRKLFQGQCAVCHGIDGHGSTGPSLIRPKLPRAQDEAALLKVIAEGIPNTGMPGSWQMAEREVKWTAAYVLSIGRVAEVKLPGNAEAGAAIYRKSGCASCHIVKGEGNGYGPELTGIGLSRSAAHLRQSIVEPAADVPGESMTVVAVTPQGQSVVGIRANEDSFTIQIRDMGGRVHSFQKSALKSLDKQQGSVMPAFNKLTASELDDLVAYLAGLRGDQ
jgi:putative heme-binding domain-containing protein